MPEMNSVKLNGVKIDLVDEVARQTAKEAKAAVGAPLVASTASQMTNTNKVYVYTGSESGYVNGNWYYYDGSAWVSGGVYNSAGIDTDKTLSVADEAADAKATGDEISRLKADLSDIDERVEDVETAVTPFVADVEDLIDIVKADVTEVATGSLAVTQGSVVLSQTHLIDVNIPNGKQYKFILKTDCIDVFHLYANGNAIKYNCTPETEYTLTASTDITWVSVYASAANVTKTGTIVGQITMESINTNSLETRVEESECITEELETIIDAETVFFKSEYEVGASINNDGNATYIYKTITFPVKAGKMLGIICDGIDNFTATHPIDVYHKNTDGTNIKTQYFTASDGKQGIKVIPDANAVSMEVDLYPSTSGGLTTTPAKFHNIKIFWSNDGTYSIKTNSVPDVYSVPFYYIKNAYLENKVDAIEALIKNANGNCDTFIFCTDQHWTLNAQQSPKLISYICQRLNISRMFMGGDYADGINLDALKAYRDSFPGKIYDVIGNHEYMNYLARIGSSRVSQTITDGDIYAYINLHMTDAVGGNFGRGYYYVDNAMQKMRYIVLSVYADNGNSATPQFDATQKTWFQNVALGTTPNDYTVLIFAHSLYSVDYDTGAVTPTLTTADIMSVVNSYSGDIACMVAGHTHVDGMTATTSGVPVFITTCDKYKPWINNGVDMEPWITANRHVGTITEQAFDVVVVDKTNRLVSFVRIGAPADNGTSAKLELRQQSY